jgi:hypothetical protein
LLKERDRRFSTDQRQRQCERKWGRGFLASDASFVRIKNDDATEVNAKRLSQMDLFYFSKS